MRPQQQGAGRVWPAGCFFLGAQDDVPSRPWAGGSLCPYMGFPGVCRPFCDSAVMFLLTGFLLKPQSLRGKFN